MELFQIVLVLVLPVLGGAGLINDKRIANGNNAGTYDFTYIASYQYKNQHICGSIIISPYWLLIAAHCIERVEKDPYYNIQQVKLVAGIVDLSTSPSTKQTQSVYKQFIHHNYNPNTLTNDIGLIAIIGEFLTGNGVNFISIARHDVNLIVTFAGWGYLRSSYPVPSPRLQYAVGDIITNNQCNTIVGPLGGTVTNNMVCIVGRYKKNETTCDGDSGGPIVQRPVGSNTDQVIGIISWDVKPCGLAKMPSVGTLIYPYLNWINCIAKYLNVNSCLI